MHKENDQLLRKIVQTRGHIEVYEKKLEAFKKGESSSQSSKPTDPFN